MIKELIILAGIVAAIFFGYQLYLNNWDFAATTTSVTSLIAPDGATNTDSIIGAISGVAGAGTIAKLAYGSLKKEATQKVNDLSNVVVDKNTEIEAVKQTAETEKAKLLQQIETLKASTPDTSALQAELDAQKQLNEKLSTQLDALNNICSDAKVKADNLENLPKQIVVK